MPTAHKAKIAASARLKPMTDLHNSAGHVLLARQPIYDRDLNIWGYELLFRSSTRNQADISSGDAATSEVLLNAFGEAGLYEITGDRPALINFTRTLIFNLPPFDPNRYAIEILEDIETDDELIAALKKAKQGGTQLILDDFILNHRSAPLLHIADMIKVDVLAISEKTIEKYAKVFLPRNIKLLAEKVETYDMYQYCKSLGYQYFQGYFLSRPQIIHGRKISENKLVVLRILSELQRKDASLHEISKILEQDPQLSYKLLRLVNSAAFARVAKCSSLQQAVTLLGLEHIRSWASLIALGQLEDKPEALRQQSIERALMCQSIGKKIGHHAQQEYYTIGLFSLLDAFLDQPLDDILDRLQLPNIFTNALLTNEGFMGIALQTTLMYERGEFGQVDFKALEHFDISPEYLDNSYREAISKADILIKEIN